MLAVTGIGMVSSLGLDVATSCAAARAGLLRARELDDLFVYDAENEVEIPVIGHQVRPLSAGLFGNARLLQLLLGALDDLRHSHEPANQRPVGFVLVTRSELHRSAWLKAVRENPELVEGEFDVDAADEELASQRQRLSSDLLSQVIDRGKIAVEPRARHAILADQTGFIGALDQAERWLREGVCQTCWIGSVDSYLDPDTIVALRGLRLLKTPDNPVGLMPGELAGFLAVEDSDRVRREQRRISAVIESFAQTTDAKGRLTDEPSTFEPLLRAMATAHDGGQDTLAVVNLNGDTARAAEWGNIIVARRARSLPDHTGPWIPPLHFGEIGAATGTASVAMLACAWSRNYAPSPRALVSLFDDGQARGAFSVSAPPPGVSPS